MNPELEKLLSQYQWEKYDDAYGKAVDFPKYFQSYLETPDDEKLYEEKHELFNQINHQRTYYPVTPIAYDFFLHALPHVDTESREFLLETVCSSVAFADCSHAPEARLLIHDYDQPQRDCLEVLKKNESILRDRLQEFPEVLIFVAAMLKFDWPEIKTLPRDNDAIKGVLYFYELQHEKNPVCDATSPSCRFFESARLCGATDQTDGELQMIWDQIVQYHFNSSSYTVSEFQGRLGNTMENNPPLKSRLLRHLLKQKQSYNDLSYLVDWTRTEIPSDVTDQLLEQIKATKEFWEPRNRYQIKRLARDFDWFPENCQP